MVLLVVSGQHFSTGISVVNTKTRVIYIVTLTLRGIQLEQFRIIVQNCIRFSILRDTVFINVSVFVSPSTTRTTRESTTFISIHLSSIFLSVVSTISSVL